MKKENSIAFITGELDVFSVKNNNLYLNDELYDDLDWKKKGDVKPHAKMANEIIDVYMKKIDGIDKKYVKKINKFEDTVKFLDRIYEAKCGILSIKELNCSTYSSGRCKMSTYDNFKWSLQRTLSNLINNLNLSEMKLTGPMIACVNNLINLISSDSASGVYLNSKLEKLYNPVTDTTKKCKALVDEYINFPYTKYSDHVPFIKITSDADEQWTALLLKIKNFKEIKNFCKENIVDWTGGNLTRKLNKAKIDSNHYSYHDWIDQIREDYIKKGRTPKGKTKSDQNRLDLMMKVEREKELTEEEWFYTFKYAKAKDLECISNKMPKGVFFKLFDLDCKKTQENLNYSPRGYCNHGTLWVISTRLFKTKLKKDEFVKLTNELVKRGNRNLIEWETLCKFKDFVSTELTKNIGVSIWGNYYHDEHVKVTDEQYDKLIKPLENDKDRYKVNRTITKELLKRADDKEVISFLKMYNKSDKILVNLDQVKDCFINLPYNDIREIVTCEEYIVYFVNAIIKNNDKESATKVLKREMQYLSSSLLSLFKLFTFEEKWKITLPEEIYSDELTEIYTKKEMETVLERAIKRNKGIGSCIKEMDKEPVNKVIDNFKPFKITVDQCLIEKFNVENKIRFQKEKMFKVSKYSYYSSNNNENGFYRNFFKDFTREDIYKLYEEKINFANHKYNYYMGNAMTDDELINNSTNRDFLLENIEIVPDSVIKNLKEKDQYYWLVQNSRTNEGRAIADRVKARFEQLKKAA